MTNIWVLAGGPSTEHEVSLSSGRVVTRNMTAPDRAISAVVIGRDGRWHVARRPLEDDAAIDAFFSPATAAPPDCDTMDAGAALSRMIAGRVDCAFLALHGQFGEDGRVQGLLQAGGIPFTGSGVRASALTFHKGLSILVYRGAGLRTARSHAATSPDQADEIAARVAFPVFVKPNQGGSSVGIRLVHDASALRDALALSLEVDAEALVEERIVGVEVSAGVLDVVRGGRVETISLPPTEIRPVDSEYFDYDAKYLPGRSREITPAELPVAVLERVREVALRAHQVLGCEGMSRTDMIVPPDEGAEPVLLETNTIPGMTPTSLLPQQAAAVGITFPKLIDTIIAHALHRAGR